MQSMRKALILNFVALLSCASFGYSQFETSTETASQQAAEHHKDILIIYKGVGWNPDEYGRPERILKEKDFLAYLQKQYILLERPLPNDLAIGTSEKEKNTAFIFADEKGRPFYSYSLASINDPQWFREEEKLAAIAKKKLIPILDQLPSATGKAKFKLVGQLYSSREKGTVTSYEPSYVKLFEEVEMEDFEDISQITETGRKIAHNAIMSPGILRQTLLALKDYKDNGEFKIGTQLKIYDKIYSDILDKDEHDPLLKQACALSLMNGIAVITDIGYSNFDEFENIVNQLVKKVIAISPGSRHALWVEKQGRYICLMQYLLFTLQQTEDIGNKIKIINQHEKRFESSLICKQSVMMAKGKYLIQTGKIDDGLQVLKLARDLAPWEMNAVEIDQVIRNVESKREEIGNMLKQGKKEELNQLLKMNFHINQII